MNPALEHSPCQYATLTCSSAFGGLELLRARFVTHAFVPHSHPEYTVGFIKAGRQQFRYRGAQHHTPSSGFFVLHPDEAHTGKATDEAGFEYRAFYPTPTLMALALEAVGKTSSELPFFREVVQQQPDLSHTLNALLEELPLLSTLEAETRVLDWLFRLLERSHFGLMPEVGVEPSAVKCAREYLEAHLEHNISLQELAARVELSPFYFARAFARAVGLPPHAYHENVRVARAKILLEAGMNLGEVAFLTGFSHQSHFTGRFRRHVGLSPGRYQQGRYQQAKTQQSKITQDLLRSSR